jgi:2-polyprenyl-3-methyl-5-hydroxy-6-metoxy-1,4-benzoquinol methylase
VVDKVNISEGKPPDRVSDAESSFKGAPSLGSLGPYQAEVKGAVRWDEEYESGRWDFLGNLEELCRFSIVVGYCAYLKPDGFILELGCGPGILMRRLRRVGYAYYCGVDQSKKAIELARVDQNENTSFEVADAEVFEPCKRFDVVVFSEMMFYLADPRGTFLRYAKYLRPGGIVIISMYQAENIAPMWRLLEGVAPVCDAVSVTNSASRLTWDIKVYAGF